MSNEPHDMEAPKQPESDETQDALGAMERIIGSKLAADPGHQAHRPQHDSPDCDTAESS